MKHQTIKLNPAFLAIYQSMSESDLRNGYYGGSNHTANFINDYSIEGINNFISDCLDNKQLQDYLRDNDIQIRDVYDNPDYLIQLAASGFFSSFCCAFSIYDHSDIVSVFRKKCKMYFDANACYARFYLFADPISNALSNYYLIKADNEAEAIQTLICEYEDDFIVSDESEVNQDDLMNDNGVVVNIDNLQLIAELKGE